MLTVDRIVGVQEDLSPALKYINANKAPFYLNLVGLGKTRETQATTVSWIDYTCEGTQTILTEAVATVDATTMKVADADVFKINCYARIGEEIIQVSSIDTATKTLTVERGKLGTTAVTHDIATAIYFINDNIAEGADLQGATYKAGENYSNYTQIIREEIEISGTAEAITLPSSGGLDAYSFEQTRKMDLMVAKIEKAVVAGKKFQEGKNRGMDGIRNILDKGQIVDANSEKISLDHFGALLEKAYSVGADLQNGYYAFYVPPKQQANITKLLEKYLKKEVSDTASTLGATVTQILTDFGLFPIIMTPNIPANEILLVNHDDCELRPLSSRNLTHTYMGKTGDNTKGLLVAELSLEVRNIHGQGKITNLGV